MINHSRSICIVVEFRFLTFSEYFQSLSRSPTHRFKTKFLEKTKFIWKWAILSSHSFFCAFSVFISITICFHILLLFFLLFYHKTCTSRKYSKFYTALYCRYIIISALLVMKEVSNALTEVQGYKAKTGSHACLCMSGILWTL